MMKKTRKLSLILAIAVLLSSCASAQKNEIKNSSPSQTMRDVKAVKPPLPEKLSLNEQGIPVLRVYQVDEDTISQMDIESYLEGVLAGEMKNDWPMEALKAQAILARTFVLKFCSEKESKYENADISTDIEEAQAYDATGINDRITKAVSETEGLVLSNEGELPYAWFHAHSGGMTALAQEGLGYRETEPDYTQVVKGMDSDQAPADAAAWEATFTVEAVIKAAKECGTDVEKIENIQVGERGKSGRAVTLLINDQQVSAPELRIALGSSEMRSTLLSSLRLENGNVVMTGKGYGHGVGMPQWGAYALAEEGKNAEEIVTYYFKDVTVEKVW